MKFFSIPTFLGIILYSGFSVGQITFERSYPLQSINPLCQSKDGYYFMAALDYPGPCIIKYDSNWLELKRLYLPLAQSQMIISDDEIIMASKNVILPYNDIGLGITITRLNHDLELKSSIAYDYGGIVGNLSLVMDNQGRLNCFYIKSDGAHLILIDKNEVQINKIVYPTPFLTYGVDLLNDQSGNNFLIMQEYAYEKGYPEVFARISKVDLTGSIVSEVSLDSVQIISAFFKKSGLDLVYTGANSIEVYSLDFNCEVIGRKIVIPEITLNHTTPTHAIENGGLEILGISTGLELPSGFFIFRTDSNYVVTDTVLFDRRKMMPNYVAGFKPTSDKGFLVYGDSYVMKMDADLSTGYIPEFQHQWITEAFPGYKKVMYWIDFDNDGDYDFTTIDKFFQNDGDGTFSEISNIFDAFTGVSALSFGDYDNDGFTDIFVCRTYENTLLKNLGNGSFEEIRGSGLTEEKLNTVSARWIDFNADGYLDLYLSDYYYVESLNSYRTFSKLYANEGDGSFSRVFSDKIKGGNIWMDVNNDRYPDLIGSNGLLLINEGGKDFDEKTFADYFDAKYFPIYFGTSDWDPIAYTDAGKPSRILAIGELNYIYDLNDSGKYVIDDIPFYLDLGEGAIRSSAFDFNNDQLQDVLVNGTLLNRADSKNSYTSLGGVPELHWQCDTYSLVDLNSDGYLDIVSNSDAGIEIMTNEKNSNNWIKIQPEGVAASSQGIGALVRVKTDNVWQTKQITTNAGQNEQIGTVAEFGVGTNSLIDSLVVEWPSGCTQVLTKVSVNTNIPVKENCSGENPVVRWDKNICENELLTIQVSNPGTQFEWYSDLFSNEPFASGGNLIEIDTLTKSTVLYIANADSVIRSRKIPVQIIVYPKPDFQVLHDTLNSYQYVFFPNKSGGIEQYSWTINDLSVSNQDTARYDFPTSGIYNVCLEGSNPGCSVEACETLEVIITGLDELAKEGFKVFPNPVTNYLFVTNLNHMEFDIQLIDMNGRKFYNADNREAYEIPFTNIPAGIYLLLVISNEGKALATKIVKK